MPPMVQLKKTDTRLAGVKIMENPAAGVTVMMVLVTERLTLGPRLKNDHARFSALSAILR